MSVYTMEVGIIVYQTVEVEAETEERAKTLGVRKFAEELGVEPPSIYDAEIEIFDVK